MAHNSDPPAFKQTLTQRVDAVIHGVEQAIHDHVVDPLRHALTDFVVFVLDQVSRTSSHMSVSAHQRLDSLAPRMSAVEAVTRTQAERIADHEERLAALEQYRTQENRE